jgi:hypothetical protein
VTKSMSVWVMADQGTRRSLRQKLYKLSSEKNWKGESPARNFWKSKCLKSKARGWGAVVWVRGWL